MRKSFIALSLLFLAGCNSVVADNFPLFYGEEGETLIPIDEKLHIPASEVSDGQAHYYNVDVDGEPVFFFVIRDSDGNYRAAANACQVCFGSNLGFHQEGDYMVCDTCGSQYPLEKIATEKGGCNPGPINSNIEVIDGELLLDMTDIAADDVVGLFDFS